MPAATLHAVAAHGAFRGDTITGTQTQARAVLHELADAAVDYDQVVAGLEQQAVQSFDKAWSVLREATLAQLERFGAQLRPDGSSNPAASGPAGAAPDQKPHQPRPAVTTRHPDHGAAAMTAPTPPRTSHSDTDVLAATVDEDGQPIPGPERDSSTPALTTDEAAQRDDTVIQPGNS